MNDMRLNFIFRVSVCAYVWVRMCVHVRSYAQRVHLYMEWNRCLPNRLTVNEIVSSSGVRCDASLDYL